MHRRAKCFCEVSSVMNLVNLPRVSHKRFRAIMLSTLNTQYVCGCASRSISTLSCLFLSILPIDFCILLSTGTSFLTSTPKIPTVWTIAECFIGNEFRLNTSLMLHNVPRSLFVLFFCFAPDIFWKLTLTPDDRQRSCWSMWKQTFIWLHLGTVSSKIYVIAKTGSNSSWKCSYRPI